jgi:LysM repeat protein
MFSSAAPWHGRRGTLILILVLASLVGGCSPDAFLVADEDRERNFLRAREAERLGDYKGAAEFYELAIEKNPRSAAVHLGYASLCEGALKRHADAVYHYQRYLKLRGGDPRDAKAESIRRRITNCTEQLATSVPLVIRSETIARDLAAVRNENRQLRLQVTNLTAGLGYWSNEWSRASVMLQQAMAGGAGGGGVGGGVGVRGAAGERAGGGERLADRGSARLSGGARSALGDRSRMVPVPQGSGVAGRTHRVVRGETMQSVGRRYGVSAESLMRANPHVRPRTMPVGTLLRIPER